MAPIFSNVASSSSHAGSDSVSPHWFLALRSMASKYLNNGDLPLPVGIPIETQSKTGSTHSVPGTLTQAWLIANEMTIRSPPNTAIGGMLTAFPTCTHPYMKQVKDNVRCMSCIKHGLRKLGSLCIQIFMHYFSNLLNNWRVVSPVNISLPASLQPCLGLKCGCLNLCSSFGWQGSHILSFPCGQVWSVIVMWMVVNTSKCEVCKSHAACKQSLSQRSSEVKLPQWSEIVFVQLI